MATTPGPDDANDPRRYDAAAPSPDRGDGGDEVVAAAGPPRSGGHPGRRGRAAGPMTGHALSGYSWMISQSVASQVINLGGAVVLGNILSERDYGLFVQVVMISAFGALVNQIGIRQILVTRSHAWRSYANPAAWMLGMIGLVVGAGIALCSPLLERAFNAPGLAPLVAAIAIGVPFNAVMVVPETGLQLRLRFRVLATVQFVRLAAEMAAMITLGLAGFGAWALVLPRLAAIVLTSVVLWLIARPALRPSPQVRRWRLFVRDMRPLIVSNGCGYLTNQLDRIALSLFQSPAVVGIYGFALRLALRPALLFGQSLEKVLFPVLRTMHATPDRQRAAFLRAERLLATVAAPICILTSLGAAPLFAVALPDRWSPAIGVLQVLGPAILFQMVGRPARALIDANGEFGLTARLGIIHAVALTAVMLPAASFGLLPAALGFAAVTVASGVLRPMVAVRKGPRPWAATLAIFQPAVPAALIAAGVGIAGVHLVRTNVAPGPIQPWIEGATVLGIVTTVYPLAVRVLHRPTWDELLALGRTAAGRIARRVR